MRYLLELIKKYPRISFLVVLFIIFVILYFSLLIHNSFYKKNYSKKVKETINTNRIYVVDYGRDRALFFDKNNFTRRVEGDLDLFFDQFEKNAIPGIKSWLDELLLNNKSTPYFFEADVNVNKMRSTFFSLLQVVKVDRTRGIFYLESYLLKYLFPKNQMNPRLQKREKSLIRSQERVEKIYYRAKAKQKGALIVVRFYKVVSRQESDIDLEKLLITKLKDRLMEFLNTNRVSMDLDNLLVGVFDGKARNIIEVKQIVHSINVYLRRYIKINGIDGYSFTVGVAEAKYFDDYLTLVDMAKSMTVVAETMTDKVAFYDPDQPDTVFDTTYYRKELDLFIKEKRFEVLFRPIVQISNLHATGYLCYISPTQTLFNSFSELKEYAQKAQRGKELFSGIARKVTSVFYNEVPNKSSKLFFPVQIIDRDSIVRSLQRIIHVNSLNIVMTFDEDDLHIVMNSVENIVKDLESIKEAGFEVSLTITDFELTLTENIYSSFDYFIVDATLIDKTRKDNRNLLLLLSALGRLLKYKKPIILSDIATMSDIEYFIRAGIDYISSDEISKKSSMILPLDKKKITRLTNIKNKR